MKNLKYIPVLAFMAFTLGLPPANAQKSRTAGMQETSTYHQENYNFPWFSSRNTYNTPQNSRTAGMRDQEKSWFKSSQNKVDNFFSTFEARESTSTMSEEERANRPVMLNADGDIRTTKARQPFQTAYVPEGEGFARKGWAYNNPFAASKRSHRYKSRHDYTRRLMTSNKNAYNNDWEYPHWQPTDWFDGEEKTMQDVVNDLYENGVIVKQYLDYKGIPVLRVGQTFLELSPRDQRRTVEFIAYAFDIASINSTATMQVVLDRKHTPVGMYADGEYQYF